MAYWFRFIRLARKLKPNEVQAKIPMLDDPSNVGKAKKAWGAIPVRDPEIYPLLLCTGLGAVMFVAYGTHLLTKDPAIAVSKEKRETPVMDRIDPEEVKEFTKHRHSMATIRATRVTTGPRVSTLTDVDTKKDPDADSPHSRK